MCSNLTLIGMICSPKLRHKKVFPLKYHWNLGYLIHSLGLTIKWEWFFNPRHYSHDYFLVPFSPMIGMHPCVFYIGVYSSYCQPRLTDKVLPTTSTPQPPIPTPPHTQTEINHLLHLPLSHSSTFGFLSSTFLFNHIIHMSKDPLVL